MNEGIKKSNIKFVIGLAFILFGIFGLINVGYLAQTIVIMLTFVFGFIGYWFIFPLLIATGIFLIVTHKKETKIKNVYIIFIGLLLFAILILSTILVYYPSSTTSLRVSNFNQLFYSTWLNSCPPCTANGYMRVSPLASNLGGGWFGYLFASLLNSSITPLGGMLSMIFIMVIALIILLFNPIKVLIKKIKDNKAKKIEDEKMKSEGFKMIENQEKEKQFEFDINKPIENENTPTNNNELLKKANLFGDNNAPIVNETNNTNLNTEGIHIAKLDEEKEELEQGNIEKENEVDEKITPVIKKPLKPYKLPNFDLLTVYKNDDALAKNEEHCKENEDVINKTFSDFRIGAKVTGHTIGPRVTRYDVKMDENYSVQAIPKYMQDIKLRLGGVPARFESVVVGKTTSGLEVPNLVSSTIGFKEMIEAFPIGEKYRLLIPFGKNISGEIKYADLAGFPHLLVAGSTGSGKSVFVHSVILALIMRNTPEELKLLLVDPKRVEFTKYKNLPHLLCPTVTEPQKAQVVLKKLTEEMNKRYTLFENTTTSKITEYNELMRDKKLPIMPYIVVVVDEFADLIQQNKKIDQDIATIAAKARAAGIHLIIATQRPSVDVITGTIKNNLPVRVALSVPDQESSKTIIGGQGAEALLGNGDMLVMCPQIQANGTARVQGCFVSNKEIANVVEFINEQREPTYDPRFLDLNDYEAKEVENASAPKISAAEARAQSDDELFILVKEQTYKREYTSISLIERENGIGFNRAGRMFKRLQDSNLVALESEASKGCKVLKENFNIKEHTADIGSEELTSLKNNN